MVINYCSHPEGAEETFAKVQAAEVYVRWKGQKAIRCAKLHHHHHKRCISVADIKRRLQSMENGC